MNFNVKVDGEEEQTLQYVNRYAINIPSSAATYNLNIVNPGLSNQSYILNPVTSVSQNVVSYQPPMALQSYIALPTETEGNILHSLPVGVPVPVGLPVSTGLIQNCDFVNTSIIIGNEDCNSSGVLKSSPNNVNSGSELKFSYIQKPVEGLTDTSAAQVQNMGLNCASQISPECVIKKLCPLEMSIKAANIDMEFEKPESEISVLRENRNLEIGKQHLVPGTVALGDELKDQNLKVPLELSSFQNPSYETQFNGGQMKKIRTEITWENNNFKEKVISNDFQESLICEVEEVNDDDDDEDNKEDEDEVSCGGKKTCDSEYNQRSTFNHIEEASSSSEESDALPLSVALKLRKVPKRNSCGPKKGKKGRRENTTINTIADQEKVRQKKSQRSRKQIEKADCDIRWSESDDDALNLKRIKNDFNYKCYYEPGNTKSATSLVIKLDDRFKKFVRVRICCSEKQCGKNISVKDQKAAHKSFYDLESNAQRDAYLINCIEHVQKNKKVEKENAKEKYLTEEEEESLSKSDEKQLMVTTNIQLEIENESNGNQKLSDEIQNAINESLKDCIVNERRKEEEEIDVHKLSDGTLEEGEAKNSEKGDKNNWNFYIVIDKCRKKVCLQFLIKVFRITKSRIKHLQKKILSGMPLGNDSNSLKTSQKVQEIRGVAKSHLDSLVGDECLDCSANPRHRFFPESCSKEDLFVNFKEYYLERVGREPNIKYNSYKRFLDKETSVSFIPKKEGSCAQCEELAIRQKRKQNKSVKGPHKAKKLKSNSEISPKRKKGASKTDSDQYSSDDEPLVKRKKIKLTISLKAPSNTNKTQHNVGKRNWKNSSGDNRSRTKLLKEKSRQSNNRGRDVWSLMLLHLETMPYKECNSCTCKKKHRFLNPTFTTQALFEDYRKYFMKETNSELGLGFTMYEKYFAKNCNYTIAEVNVNAPSCPRCIIDMSKS